jgi:hypothetical protein
VVHPRLVKGCRSNSDNRRHAARAASVAPVGIKEVRVACGAEIDCGDMARCEPRATELIFCHRNQVKIRGGSWIRTVPSRLDIRE